MTEQFANQALTTLTAELAEGATTLTVASTTRFPSEGNFRILIDSELMMVTAVEGTTFTVERGIEGTEDIAHADSSTVTQVLTAGGLATKADLEEGTLREDEIPSSVLVDSQLPAIYASRHGVSAANTGEENSEALASAIAEAEETSIGRILLPGGVISLESGFLLNKADDEDGSFQYVVQGSGRSTVLDLDAELDWLFRLNCTEGDEPAHPNGNLLGRLQLRDLTIQGTEGGSSGLVRTIAASVQMVNVRGIDLDRGVYQISGYADHHTFDRVWWKADPESQSWFFETKSNGDGHVFKACTFFSPCKAAKLLSTNGAVIDACIGGVWEILASTGVEIREHHLDNALFEEELPAPWLRIEDSRVKVSGGFLLVSQAQPLIEVDDPEVFDATQLILAGVGFGWRNGDPRVDPPRNSHLHIAAASARARFVFESPRAFTTNQGSSISNPVGVVVTSDVENIQAAVDARGELLNGNATLSAENGADWRVRPASPREAKRYSGAPVIGSAGASTGIGGTLPASTTRYYALAVWDGFQWSAPSEEATATTEEKDEAITLTVSLRSPTSKVRVWYGAESGEETGEYDGYCDLTVPTAATRLVDTGEYLCGIAWITEEVPKPPEANAQRTLVELAGTRVLFSSTGAPTNGEWKQGDIVLRTNPEAGGTVGFVCVESGETTTWKTFGAISE